MTGLRSIGAVIEVVRPEFPHVTISKVRYLEREGLLSPEREESSGYRRYSRADIDRLRYILRAQRDFFLPLRVIRDNLERMDRGEEVVQTVQEPVPAEVPIERTQSPAPSSKGQRLSRRHLLELSGLPESTLIELERAKIITMRRGAHYYGRDALMIAIAAKRLAAYGIDTRHFRLMHAAAAQEAALIDQAIAPYARQRSGVDEASAEVFKLITHAHIAMLQSLTGR